MLFPCYFYFIGCLGLWEGGAITNEALRERLAKHINKFYYPVVPHSYTLSVYIRKVDSLTVMRQRNRVPFAKHPEISPLDNSKPIRLKLYGSPAGPYNRESGLVVGWLPRLPLKWDVRLLPPVNRMSGELKFSRGP